MNLKYISTNLLDIYSCKYINYQNHRLKSINMINIIDMFLLRYIMFNKDSMTLNSRYLKKLYGSLYSKYIDYLIEHNFIYLYKNYSAGLRSKTYKLSDNIKNNKIITISVKIPKRLQTKIDNFNFDRSKEISSYVKEKMINDLYRFDIDLESSKKWIDRNLIEDSKSYLSNLTVAKKIANKNLYYSFDDYGRFHTNFTTLKREIRENYLTFNNEKLKEIDITNSQPFFLYILMKSTGFKDFDQFDSDVLSGVIYDKISQKTGHDRKTVKPNIYSVLFGRNMNASYWNDLFGNLYPNVYKWIKEYKKQHKNYKIIAQTLQSLESEFMFSKLLPNIIAHNKNIPILTIHDSILIPERYYHEIYDIFIDSINEIII